MRLRVHERNLITQAYIRGHVGYTAMASKEHPLDDSRHQMSTGIKYFHTNTHANTLEYKNIHGYIT